MKIAFSFAVSALLASSFASATDIDCHSTVPRILINTSGGVNIWQTARGDYTYICNLQVDWKGVKPSTCAMWTSLIQSQRQAAKKVYVSYTIGGTFTSCENIPIYGDAPAPVYVGALE